MSRDRCLGSRAAGRQRHRRRLQGCAILRGRRGALLVRGHVSDPESHSRQSHHRAERLHLKGTAHQRATYTGEYMMDASATEKQPAATPKLANVLYEKKGAIAYVTVNRPKVLNALNTPTWKDLRPPSRTHETTPQCSASSWRGPATKRSSLAPTSASSHMRPRSTPNGRAASARACLISSRI